MRAWGRRVSVALAIVTLAACTGSEEELVEVPLGAAKIGLVAPLSGSNADAGRDAHQGAELAVALINEEHGDVPLALAPTAGLPGLGGQPISLITADTASNPSAGATETVRLVSREDVAGIVGASDVAATAVASLAAERLTTPFVNGDVSASHLTERGLGWFFRVGPTDRMVGEALFSVLVEQEAAGASTRRIAILHGGDRRGAETAADVAELAAEGRYTVAATVPFTPGGADLADRVEEIEDAEPDVVFLATSSSADASRLVGAFEAADYTPDGLMALGSGFAGTAFTGGDATAAEGLFRGVAWSRELAARNPAASAVMDRYQDAYGTPMTETAAGAFTAVLTLALAIDASESVAPEQVRTALNGLSEPGRATIMPWNGVQFDAAHQNASAAGTVEQWRSGQPWAVFPQEVAEVSAVWPRTRAQ